MIEQNPAPPEHIYLSVVEAADDDPKISVPDVNSRYSCLDAFRVRCVHKIYQADPGALAGRDKISADIARDAGSSTFSVSRVSSAMRDYPLESYVHFMGNGDKVARALCKIFNCQSEPNEPVLFKVAEQLSGNPVLETVIHPENSRDGESHKRVFMIIVIGKLHDYMSRHP